MVVSGLVNVANVVSRMAIELAYWSTDEFGFLEMGTHGVSFMMPQKSTNPNSLERVRLYAGQMIGALTSVAVAGLREPQADTHAMLHMEDATLQAIELADGIFTETTQEMREMKVHEDRMREVVEGSYIASTELANQLVREYEVDYRTGHEIINQFVRASEEAGIPASQARAEMLEEVAEEALGRKLGMTDERLRELLDPARFVEVTDSKGGVAPHEMARVIADRRGTLQAARERHMARIEALEQAQARMVADLQTMSEQGGQ